MDHVGALRAFGRRIRGLRVARGLSQEQLAFEAEVDRTFLNRLECGRYPRGPTLKTVFKLATALRVPPRRLF